MDGSDQNTENEAVFANRQSRVLIVDDHPIWRKGLINLVRSALDVETYAQVGSARKALDAMKTVKPDLVILGLSLPDADGIELIKSMKREEPAARVLAVAMDENEEKTCGLLALRAGALGLVNKSEAVEQVSQALHQVMNNQPYISCHLEQYLLYRVVHKCD
jgi:DNA-binding NarL/FixJ family response regulator